MKISGLLNRTGRRIVRFGVIGIVWASFDLLCCWIFGFRGCFGVGAWGVAEPPLLVLRPCRFREASSGLVLEGIRVTGKNEFKW